MSNIGKKNRRARGREKFNPRSSTWRWDSRKIREAELIIPTGERPIGRIRGILDTRRPWLMKKLTGGSSREEPVGYPMVYRRLRRPHRADVAISRKPPRECSLALLRNCAEREDGV